MEKYLVEEGDEDVHCEFVSCWVFFLGLLTYLAVRMGDKILELDQFHLIKCANVKKTWWEGWP
jgi:hypothetical protein